MNDAIDNTRVKCPNECRRPAGFSLMVVTSREFRWHDGSVGTRNYCPECGSELVTVDEAGR